MSARPLTKTSSSTPAALSALLEKNWGPMAGSALPPAVWHKVLLGPVEEILARPGKGFRAHLVEAAWRLMDQEGEAPRALATIVEVLHAGSMIVDDIQDGSETRRGGPALHKMFGLPIALNAGNWMYFLPFEVLRGAGFEPETEALLTQKMLATLNACHCGQALDLGLQVGDVAQEQIAAVVEETTAMKTGALMSLAAALGGAAAGARGRTLDALERFGLRLGVALQKLDDLGNLVGCKDPDKRHEDLKNGRLSWPWVWAAESLEPDSFAKLVAAGGDVQRPSKAQEGGLEWLAARLKSVAGADRRALISAEVMASLRDLECVFGRNPTTAFLRNEVSRLEASYG